jgi:hypothetical protein
MISSPTQPTIANSSRINTNNNITLVLTAAIFFINSTSDNDRIINKILSSVSNETLIDNFTTTKPSLFNVTSSTHHPIAGARIHNIIIGLVAATFIFICLIILCCFAKNEAMVISDSSTHRRTKIDPLTMVESGT